MELIIYGAAYPDIVKLVNAINKDQNRYTIIGFVDDTPSKQNTEYMGFSVLGGREILKKSATTPNTRFINNVGSSTAARQKVSQIMIDAGCQFATLIHPNVDTTYTTIGEGTIICAILKL